MNDQIIRVFSVIVIMCSVFIGCKSNQQPIVPISDTDHPVYHYVRGMELIWENDINAAQKKFIHALQLNGNHAPSIAAKSLIQAIKISDLTKNIDTRKSYEKKVIQNLNQAIQRIDNSHISFIVHVTAIRVYTKLKNDKWIKNALSSYQSAIHMKNEITPSELPYYEHVKAADFFMGVAFMEAQQFEKGIFHFSNVLNERDGNKWKVKADQFVKKIQCIVRASMGYTLSKAAAQIAVKDSVTRADVSMLLIHELSIEKLYYNYFSNHKNSNQSKIMQAFWLMKENILTQ